MIDRRTFLGVAAGAAIADIGVKAATPFPIIDTHIHLYDPFRPGGTPWPNKENAVLYKTSLPARYRPIVEPLARHQGRH
jgi:hypothetical protein